MENVAFWYWKLEIWKFFEICLFLLWPRTRSTFVNVPWYFFFPWYFLILKFKKFLKFIYLAAAVLSCGMWDLVPWPGIEPGPRALGVQSLSHWTTREVRHVCLRRLCILWLSGVEIKLFNSAVHITYIFTDFFCLLIGSWDRCFEIHKFISFSLQFFNIFIGV